MYLLPPTPYIANLTMKKAKNKSTANNNNINNQNLEAFQRMNYLLNISIETAMNGDKSQLFLVKHYIHTLRKISKKLVLRIHPFVKRSICKECEMILIPEVTGKYREIQNGLKIECLHCGNERVIPYGLKEEPFPVCSPL